MASGTIKLNQKIVNINSLIPYDALVHLANHLGHLTQNDGQMQPALPFFDQIVID